MVVLDILDLAMLVLDTVMLLLLLMDTLVLATLDLDTMARDLLKPSQRPRLMLVFCMEDMDMVDMDLDMLVLDMDMLLLLLMDTPVLDMPDMEDMVLDMAVESTMVKHQTQTSKSSKVILLFSSLLRVGIDVSRLNKNLNISFFQSLSDL